MSNLKWPFGEEEGRSAGARSRVSWMSMPFSASPSSEAAEELSLLVWLL